MSKRENIILDKSFAFALDTIGLYKKLVGQKEFIISKQLLKCGTSIGANVNESIAAQSKKDFISKMSIAAKEARETKYWLQLLQESQLVSTDYNKYLLKIEEIIKILTSIIKTAQLRK
ncbi:MAG TPA: four helix bundle protein [Ignavibacteriaceae bacterium]|nr:four helix bundle protein [Ignavibacteriaceae bacterium]